MSGVAWHYVIKFIITGMLSTRLIDSVCSHGDNIGDAAVGKSSLLVRLTDQRFLANPDPTVRSPSPMISSIHHPPFPPSDRHTSA